MGMQLGIKRENFSPNEDQSWLGSAHGTQECDSITLDGDVFRAAFTGGFVPSGVVVAKNTTTNLYEPYADAGDDGTDTAAGHLFTTVDLPADGDGDVTAALLWHGEVVEANLPTDHGLTSAAKADLTHIHYV